MMPTNYRAAFVEGFRARRELGCGEDDNPHPPRSNEFNGWIDGWQTAFDEDGRHADQMGATAVPVNL